MREILFRGFHKNENGKETIYINGREIKGEWVYGYYIRYGWTRQEKDYIVPSYASDLYAKEVIPETVGQYTGLTDKNGKKIFEGDIVDFKTSAYYFKKCRIKYQSYYGRYCAMDNEGYEYPMDKNFEYEVIGNIHDNPELLGGNKMTKYELENALEQERKINKNLLTELKTAQETIHQLREEVSCAYDKGYNKGIEEFIKMIEIDEYKYNDHYGQEQHVVDIDDVRCNYNYLIKGGLK